MEGKGRFHNSARNSSVALAGQAVNLFVGFILRTIFIYKLGQVYLGVNGVMESFLALLSVTELGIGTSVAFILYKPVDEGDEERIGRLMAFYRRAYHMIGFITLAASAVMFPFMRFFTRSAEDVPHMSLIYILFVASTVLSYFFSYKRTLLSAYQQNHINTLTEDILGLVKHALQAVALLVFSSYIGFLLAMLVCTLASNIIISYICDKKYGFIKKYKNEKIYPEDEKLLKKSVVSLLYQKIGAKLVMGTDNLMISYVSIAVMGIYSNYTMVINTITKVIYTVTQAIMGSVGNLMVQKDKEHKYAVYEEIVFVEFCFYFFVSVVLSGTLEKFIGVWVGKDWVLSPAVTFAVILNFFLMGMRQPNVLVIEVAGLFNKMRMKAVAEVIVNLVVSLVFLLVLKMGIYGVLFGTTVSMTSVCIWWEINAVHKFAFKKETGRYYLNYFLYLAVCAAGCFMAYFICKKLIAESLFGLFASAAVSAALAAVMIFAVYGRTNRFKRFIERFSKWRSRNAGAERNSED